MSGNLGPEPGKQKAEAPDRKALRREARPQREQISIGWQAGQEYRAALLLDSQNADLYVRLGYVLGQQGKDDLVAQCPLSGAAGSCCAANEIIRILMVRAAPTTVRWKSRKAGERAMRYKYFPPATYCRL